VADVESAESRQLTIYGHAISFEELYKGLKQSCNTVRWKDSVAGYESNALRNTYILRQSLLNGTYKISPYQRFYITEPKKREIIATRIKDRQLQNSLCRNGFVEQITRSFIYDNCACQKGKGIQFAGNRLKHHLWKYYRQHGADGWALKCDVHHFFASINHDVAKAAVRKRLYDAEMIKRIDEVIDSYGSVGLGLGSQISQYIALAILDDLDHFIKEKLHIRRYIRYMDDFILIHESKEHLQYCRKAIGEFLVKLDLELNRKTVLFPLRHGVPFLKWKYILTDTGKIICLPDKKKLRRARSHFKRLVKAEHSGQIPRGKTAECFRSWASSMSYGNAETAIKNMKQYIGGIQYDFQ